MSPAPKCMMRTVEVEGKLFPRTELYVYEEGFVEARMEGDNVVIEIPSYASTGCHVYYFGLGMSELFYYDDGSLAKLVVEPAQ